LSRAIRKPNIYGPIAGRNCSSLSGSNEYRPAVIIMGRKSLPLFIALAPTALLLLPINSLRKPRKLRNVELAVDPQRPADNVLLRMSTGHIALFIGLTISI
jgi:hypothetical protein